MAIVFERSVQRSHDDGVEVRNYFGGVDGDSETLAQFQVNQTGDLLVIMEPIYFSFEWSGRRYRSFSCVSCRTELL